MIVTINSKAPSAQLLIATTAANRSAGCKHTRPRPPTRPLPPHRLLLTQALGPDEIAPSVVCFPLLGVGDFVDREGLKGFGLRGEYANSEYGIPPYRWFGAHERVLAGALTG